MLLNELEEILGKRINQGTIAEICRLCHVEDGDETKSALYVLIKSSDDRVGYNALWVLTHLQAADIKWFLFSRNELIDLLLVTGHVGKKRLVMTLLERMPTTPEGVRTDYLDFCFSRINSTESYAIRALALKQAYAQCRFFPELIEELKSAIEMMEFGEMSPGLLSARKNILSRIRRNHQILST